MYSHREGSAGPMHDWPWHPGGPATRRCHAKSGESGGGGGAKRRGGTEYGSRTRAKQAYPRPDLIGCGTDGVASRQGGACRDLQYVCEVIVSGIIVRGDGWRVGVWRRCRGVRGGGEGQGLAAGRDPREPDTGIVGLACTELMSWPHLGRWYLCHWCMGRVGAHCKDSVCGM